jgi:NAD(P)-dependent dehydrogenase (short-subunit alcohol dehydrogenase family)
VQLQGDVVVITGGGGGIGRAIAAACTREGARGAVVGRTRERLDETGWVPVVADLTQEDDVTRAARTIVAQFGRVDALVNNAGSAESAPFARTDRALWDRMIAINATSAFLMTRALIDELVKAKGRIVMVASQAARKGAAYVAAYTASKHAMLGLARALAAEVGPKGVRVNAVCPGYVDTPMTERSVANIVQRTGRDAGDVRRALGEMNAKGRLISPAEVADAVVSLLAKDCVRNGEAIDL